MRYWLILLALPLVSGCVTPSDSGEFSTCPAWTPSPNTRESTMALNSEIPVMDLRDELLSTQLEYAGHPADRVELSFHWETGDKADDPRGVGVNGGHVELVVSDERDNVLPTYTLAEGPEGAMAKRVWNDGDYATNFTLYIDLADSEGNTDPRPINAHWELVQSGAARADAVARYRVSVWHRTC